MQIERLVLQLRPRNAWEAIDLGFALTQYYWKKLYATWFVVFIPLVLVIHLAIYAFTSWRLPLAAFLIIWWLKPLLDRVVLHVIAGAAFAAPPTLRETARDWKKILFGSGLWWGLTLYRLDPARSFKLPIWQLEGLRGRIARERRKILARRASTYGALLTLSVLLWQFVVTISLISMLYLFLPSEFLPYFDFWQALFGPEKLPLSFLYLWDIAFLLSFSLLEPFYVVAGFSLYLHRRTVLEGWDLELAFRQMTTRVQTVLARSAAFVILGTLITLTDHLAAQENRPPPKQAIEEILRHPDFSEHATEKVWKSKVEQKKPELPEWLKPLLDLFAQLGKAFAQSLQVILWGAAILILALLLYWMARNFDWSNLRLRARKRLPSTLFGVDLRPESLPDDIATAAKRLLEQGEILAALSLLYRGALVALLNRYHLEFRSGDTENDCVRRVNQCASQATAAYFTGLVNHWLSVAYAARLPEQTAVAGLCNEWNRHFLSHSSGSST